MLLQEQNTDRARPSPATKLPTMTVVGGGATGEVHPLRSCKMIIGRRGADLSFEASGLSDRHAMVVVAADRSVVVVDLRSLRGTRINGVSIDVATMEPGDTLQLGDALELRLDAQATASTRLSPRQEQVARLVARGCTSREIAKTLCISERTVSRHLENVYTQLGLHNRASLTRWILEHSGH